MTMKDFPMKKAIPFAKELEVFSDDRGVFVPFIQNANKLENGQMIKRVYYIYNYGKKIIRGFHLHKKEWKYFTIVSGAAKFVAINPENSKNKYEFISSIRKPTAIVIPPDFANGWVSLEENTILLAASTETIEESLADDKRFDPYKWGDVWSVKGR